ncbi:hypothetical protein N9L20_06360 [Flavobacteriaceae bacterium]|nr:hypothetical protein [Flavobacteriaceae bacterium]
MNPLEANKPKNQQRAYVFVFFLVLSTIFWLLIKLSNTYSSVVNYDLIYRGIPNDKILQNKPTNQIKVIVSGTGYRILNEKLVKRTLYIDAGRSFETVGGYYILEPNSQLGVLESQRGSVQFQNILKDTLHMDFGVLVQKKIPVSLVQNIAFKPGFHHDGIYHLKPDSVQVKGPEKYVEQLSKINTIKLSMNNVADTISTFLALDLENIDQNSIEVSPKTVHVEAVVEKYTEGSFELPVSIINIPKGISLSVFPKSVKLYYQTSLSRFNSVKIEDFKIIADYQKAADLGIDYMELDVKSQSSAVAFLRCEPNKVEFLITKE